MKLSLTKAVKRYKAQERAAGRAREIAARIRKNAKQVINWMRKGNIRACTGFFREIERDIVRFNKLIKDHSVLTRHGFYREAVEEYIEAKALCSFLLRKKLAIPKFVMIEPEALIAGISDFTGELVRRAISIADLNHFGELTEYRNVIEEIAEHVITVAQSGKLRQKYDEIERNSRRIEEILYDLRIRQIRE